MLQRLLYYTADVEQAISLMEKSGLKREKWYKKRAGTDYQRSAPALNKFNQSIRFVIPEQLPTDTPVNAKEQTLIGSLADFASTVKEAGEMESLFCDNR